MNSVVSPSRRQILQAIVQMPEDDYLALVGAAAARRRTVKSAVQESALVKRIQLKPARALVLRQKVLHEANLEGQLSRQEREELLRLTDLLEGFAVERLRLVQELAGMRGWTLERTWKSLGIGKGLPLYG